MLVKHSCPFISIQEMRFRDINLTFISLSISLCLTVVFPLILLLYIHPNKFFFKVYDQVLCLAYFKCSFRPIYLVLFAILNHSIYFASCYIFKHYLTIFFESHLCILTLLIKSIQFILSSNH